MVDVASRLAGMRREARQARRAVERARVRGVDLASAISRSQEATRQYRRAIYLAKRDGWREFVRTAGNDDPWGVVYRVCRGRHANQHRIGPLVTGGRELVEWGDMMEVLLDRFFSADRGPQPQVDPSMERSSLEITPSLV